MVSSVATEKIPSDTNGDRFRDSPTGNAVKERWNRCISKYPAVGVEELRILTIVLGIAGSVVEF
jgi:hypothetical protein